jgi:hypothetical protein
MRKLMVLLLALTMLLFVGGISMAAVNIRGSLSYSYYMDYSDFVTKEPGGARDQFQLSINADSKISNTVNFYSGMAVNNENVGWDIMLDHAYFDVKTGVGTLRVGDVATRTRNTKLFDDSKVCFSRIKGWMALGYTSPDLGIKGLKFKTTYYGDGQKYGQSPTETNQMDNLVGIKDNAYAATLDYRNKWLIVNGNLIETRYRYEDPKDPGRNDKKSSGYTFNVVYRTPIEGLQTVLYLGQNKKEQEMRIVGFWYSHKPFTFEFETDLKDDKPTLTGGNRWAYRLGYTLPNKMLLQYKHSDMGSDEVESTSRTLTLSMKFK